MPLAPREQGPASDRTPADRPSSAQRAEARVRWETQLTDELGVAVQVVFNRARTEPVRWTWSRPRGPQGLIEVRMHERFVDAPDDVRSAMGSWMRSGKRARRACERLDRWIAQHIATLPRKKRNETLRPQGEHHDLEALAAELYETEFVDDFTSGGRPRITWGRRARSRSRGSLRLGSYDPEDNLVRIHIVLDRSSVPPWFVRYVLFHEILHAALPPRPGPDGRRWIHHGPEFRRRERLYVDYRRALEWEELHLPRLIRAARRITPRKQPAPAPRRSTRPAEPPAPRSETPAATVIRWLQGHLF